MNKEARIGKVTRETKETNIEIEFILDGSGQSSVETGIPFFDHMLTLFARHGLFDLQVIARGDLDVDTHHTVEDVGLCLGQALKEALGDKKGIKRYGDCLTPMDESLSRMAIDVSGRANLSYELELPQELIKGFDPSLVYEFLKALTNRAEITIHVSLLKWGNVHHAIEAVFKGLGRALDMATILDERQPDIPSSKGEL